MAVYGIILNNIATEKPYKCNYFIQNYRFVEVAD
jgi:hypothetical protein